MFWWYLIRRHVRRFRDAQTANFEMCAARHSTAAIAQIVAVPCFAHPCQAIAPFTAIRGKFELRRGSDWPTVSCSSPEIRAFFFLNGSARPRAPLLRYLPRQRNLWALIRSNGPGKVGSRSRRTLVPVGRRPFS
jgi:hypothetical protein